MFHKRPCFFGRFDVSWTGEGTNGTRLSNWLDPASLGTISINSRGLQKRVNGPSLICTTGNYQVQNSIPGTITWSSSNTNGLTIDNTGKANRINNYNGEVTITANINGACGTESITRKVWLGTPTITYAGKIGSCYEPVLVYHAPLISGATYSWSINTNKLDLAFSGNESYISHLDVADGTSQAFNLTVTITQGGCTETKTISGIYKKPTKCDCGYSDPSCGGSGGPPSPLSVFPVPADDQITISVASDQGNSDEVIKEVAVLNSQQVTVIFHTKLNRKDVVLNVAHLPQGLYYIQITTQKRTEVRRVYIE